MKYYEITQEEGNRIIKLILEADKIQEKAVFRVAGYHEQYMIGRDDKKEEYLGVLSADTWIKVTAQGGAGYYTHTGCPCIPEEGWKRGERITDVGHADADRDRQGNLPSGGFHAV